MSHPTIVRYNTLEQALSADVQRTGLLASSAAMEAILGMAGSHDVAITPRDCVLRGLDASPGTGLAINLSIGSLVHYNAAPLTDSSNLRLGQTYLTTSITGFTPDGALPRIARVSAAISTEDTDNSIRNVLQLPARTVSPVSIPKTRRALLTFAVTHGTAAANPAPPATPAGEVPLWDVYLPAGSASIGANDLIDLRTPLSVYSQLVGNLRIFGLLLAVSSTTQFLLGTGRAINNGAIVDLNAIQTYTASDLVQFGEGAAGANQEWHAYLIARGGGGGISRGNTVGFTLAVTQSAPDADGTPPGAGISYNPLQGFRTYAGGAPAYIAANALYVGSYRTTSTAGQLMSGSAINCLSKDGLAADRLFDMNTGGLFGTSNTWIKPPLIAYTSATQVTLTNGKPVHGGFPGSFTSLVADITANLASGEVEGASTWYYVYIRRRATGTGQRTVCREYVAVISSEAPNADLLKPTPEATFASADYVFAGSFFNNAGSNIEPFDRVGNRVTWRSRNNAVLRLQNADVANVGAFTDITAIKPATSSRVTMTFESVVTVAAAGNDAQAQLFVFHRNDQTVATFAPLVRGAANTVLRQMFIGDIQTTAAGVFRASRDLVAGTAFLLEAWEVGYIEDALAPL